MASSTQTDLILPGDSGASQDAFVGPGGSTSNLEKTEIRQGAVFGPDATLPRRVDLVSDSVSTLVGQQLDHFTIESLVGTGGMGAVFRGRDTRLDRVVAIKVVPIADRGADAMRRFRIEAQSAAKLDHPNIARVYYVGETERWSYIVFEFVEGRNLREIVLSNGPLPVDEAIYFTSQVSAALQHAHERGVVHRDIKPSNILITIDGQAKVVDMGLARTTELDRSTNDLTASGVTLGTFDYISPEQAHDPRDADVRSDIYSLGCTLYFLLTGRPPFMDGTALQKLLMHGSKMPDDPRYFRGDLSDSLIAILRKMMAKRSSDRYQEPNDLNNDLRILAEVDGLYWTRSQDSLGPRPGAARRTWIEALMPSIASLLVILAITLWMYNTQLSAVFPIPRVDVREDASVASTTEPIEKPRDQTKPSPSNQANTIAESKASVAEVATPIANDNKPATLLDSHLIIVDERWKPELRATNDKSADKTNDKANTVRTLDEAFGIIANGRDVRHIELRSAIVSLSKPAILAGTSNSDELVIESSSGQRTQLIIDGAAISSGAEANAGSWLECGDRSIVVRNLDVVFKSSNESRDRSLFHLRSGGSLELHNTSITAMNGATGKHSSLISVSHQNADSREARPESRTEVNGNGLAPIRVYGHQLCVRGFCDLLSMRTPTRVEVQFDNMWLAIGGSVFDLPGSRTVSRSVLLRSDWRNVTCYSMGPWMRMTMLPSEPNPITTSRTSRDSIFGGCNTLVEWDASLCDDWSYWTQAKRRDELDRWIDLRGTDNAYDAQTVARLFQIKMAMATDQIGLDGESPLLREERGLEFEVRWKSTPKFTATSLSELTPESFRNVSGAFRSGCLIDQLPQMPSGPRTSYSSTTTQ